MDNDIKRHNDICFCFIGRIDINSLVYLFYNVRYCRSYECFTGACAEMMYICVLVVYCQKWD